MNGGALLLTVLLLAINAYFVVVEFALVASRTARLESLLELGDRRAVAALRVVRDLPRGMGTAQLGITIASLALGYISEPAIADLVEPVVEHIGNPSDGVVHAISFLIGLGTITFFTGVSENSNTLWISSISVWSSTPCSLPSFTMCLISSSETNV